LFKSNVIDYNKNDELKKVFSIAIYYIRQVKLATCKDPDSSPPQ